MAAVLCSNGFTVLAVNRQLVVLDAVDTAAPALLVVPLPDIVVAPPKPSNGTESAGEDDEAPTSNTAVAAEDASANGILHAALAPNGRLLAATTADEKRLHLFSVELPSSIRHLSSRALSRTSSAVRFSNDSGDVLVADKTGDCFVFAAGDPEAPGRCVLSHLSMVLGIVQSPCARFLVTCDRDEKVRCTQYPRTTCIESYCLGHTEYVAGIELLPIDTGVLVSASGDKTLRLWDYLTGRQLANFELAGAALRLALSQPDERSAGRRCTVAVTLTGPGAPIVQLVEINAGDDAAKSFVCRPAGEFRLADDLRHVHATAFDAAGHVWLTASPDERTGRTQVLRLTANAERSAYAIDRLQPLNDRLTESVTNGRVSFDAEAVALLFKKKFENIHDYHERKKRRIEEKNGLKAKSATVA